MKTRRIQEMEDYIHHQGTVTLDELCDYFDVSKNTIRRDLNKIIENGHVQKVYGGVTSLNINQLQSYEKRSATYDEQKQVIGKFAASLVENGDLIFIDSGTTTRYMAKYLDPELNLTLVTNNLDVINAVADYPHYRIILIGTTFKSSTRSFVNIEDQGLIDRINISKAFMAASALSIDRGVTNSDMFEYEIKHQIVEKASKNYLLVDSSKFNKAALTTYASIESFDGIITDCVPEKKYITFCNEHDITIHYP